MPEDHGQEVGAKKTGERKKKKVYDLLIFRAWCKACGICSAFCPNNVIGRNNAGEPVIERPDECTGCRFCEIHCPDFAITVIERDEEARASGNE